MAFLKENKFLLILLILSGVCLFVSMGRYANIFIDIGREMYYPEAILDGKILYKDLFCIYGPFSYIFNALFYKLFGANLNTLYFLGGATALFITGLTYKLAKFFLDEFASFAVTLFVILTGCLAVRIFNFTLPYSYGVLYGLVFYLLSLFFMLKFLKTKSDIQIILSALFLGFSVSNKYDFILSTIPLFIVIFQTKNIKLILKSGVAFLGAFIIPFIPLFIQGLKFDDLLNALFQIKAFANTEALKTFYLTQGVYYTPKLWVDWIFKIIDFLIIAGIIYFGLFLFAKKNILLKITGISAAFVALFITTRLIESEYLFLTFLTAIFYIFTFKKNNFLENIFILSALLTGAKSLWGLSHVNYGLYYLPFILIAFFILLKKTANKRLYSSISLLLLFLAPHYADIYGIMSCNSAINTDKGKILTTKEWAEPSDELISYIKTLDKSANIMIFPEGLSINFLSDTKAEGLYSSLIPLYTEGFGEKTIIEYYKNHPHDYIIFNNMEMDSYNKGAICEDYAQEFCNFVFDNYKKIKTIKGNSGKSFIIFKNNNLYRQAPKKII